MPNLVIPFAGVLVGSSTFAYDKGEKNGTSWEAGVSMSVFAVPDDSIGKEDNGRIVLGEPIKVKVKLATAELSRQAYDAIVEGGLGAHLKCAVEVQANNNKVTYQLAGLPVVEAASR